MDVSDMVQCELELLDQPSFFGAGEGLLGRERVSDTAGDE